MLSGREPCHKWELWLQLLLTRKHLQTMIYKNNEDPHVYCLYSVYGKYMYMYKVVLWLQSHAWNEIHVHVGIHVARKVIIMAESLELVHCVIAATTSIVLDFKLCFDSDDLLTRSVVFPHTLLLLIMSYMYKMIKTL